MAVSKKPFWAAAAVYFLIGFEFIYMAGPFAAYFYAAYGPGITSIGRNPATAWLSRMFLPHIVNETNSFLINTHNVTGMFLASIGFLAFVAGAVLNNNRKAKEQGILLHALKTVPILEVHINLSQNRVTKVEELSSQTRYGEIPMPIF